MSDLSLGASAKDLGRPAKLAECGQKRGNALTLLDNANKPSKRSPSPLGDLCIDVTLVETINTPMLFSERDSSWPRPGLM